MRTIKNVLLITIIAFIGFSCENKDGGDSALVLEAGAVPNMTKAPGSDGIIDLVRLNSGEVLTIAFNADLAQGKMPASVDIIAAYVTLSGSAYTSTLASNVGLPIDYSLTTNDIIAAFSEINSADDIKLGDILRISTRFTMPDGRVLSILNDDGTDNTGTTLSNSKLVSIVINYPVSCPSNIGGTYLVSSTGTGCCGVAPITNYEYTVTVTDNGGGSYALSDYSGGAYDGLFCGPFGICGDASIGNITDVCGTLNGSAPDCCGDNIAFSGTVNDDGTWSVEVSSGFINATSVWTKQ
ncbi:hypothetical protein [Gelatiniphilus marinus]|uniref:Uncharacterized protein n=1 Tax=Gelatiniphilus marinus TaxID=1759464 RepID=A0ABW5JVI5_9FLAO